MPKKLKPIRSERRVICPITQAPAAQHAALAGPAPGPGYTNHVGSTRDGAGNVFLAVTIDGPSSGDLDVAIMKRQQGSANWTEIYRFDQATYGKQGYGTLEVVGSHLVVVLAERLPDNSTAAVEYRLYDVAVRWPQCVA
jgi:hypothetical protein